MYYVLQGEAHVLTDDSVNKYRRHNFRQGLRHTCGSYDVRKN